MQNNQSDRFEQMKNSPLQKDKMANELSSESNFFITSKTTTPINFTKQEQARRLNDYDSNLLEEDAYKDINDDLFKLEYKISRYEEDLKTIESQIQAARDISDYNLVNELVLRKTTLLAELEFLLAEYNEKSFSTKISGGLSNLFGDKLKNKIDALKSNMENFTNVLLSKLPKQFSSAIELKKSLSKLENINRSVDELMSLNAPYGENIDKYEQLSKYIIKANAIQSKISRHIK